MLSAGCLSIFLSVALYFCYDLTGVSLVDCAIKSVRQAKALSCGKLTHDFFYSLFYIIPLQLL